MVTTATKQLNVEKHEFNVDFGILAAIDLKYMLAFLVLNKATEWLKKKPAGSQIALMFFDFQMHLTKGESLC